MSTKIYVSQIDTANSSGGQAPVGAIILASANGAYWSNAAIKDLLGINQNEIVGYTGSVGYQGSAGIVGYQGSGGVAGGAGADGPQGAIGYTGSAGYTGSIGDLGYFGSAGYFGSVGYQGSVGAAGPGYTGSTGYVGSAGYFGSVGYQGSTGNTGYQGSTGAPGLISFNQLTDVPSYTGNAGYFMKINATANGIAYDSNTYITNSFSSNVSFNNVVALSPTFMHYSEMVNNIGNSGSAVTVNTSLGNMANITLNAPIVAITLSATGLITGRSFSITLKLKQDSTGTRIVDWSNQNIYWPLGEGVYAPAGPTLSTNPNYTDFVTLMTFDAGTSWFGFMSGKGFATT